MIQDEDINQKRLQRRSGKSRLLTGLFLVAAGGMLLVQRMNHPFPGWVFTWPMLLLAISLFAGIRKKFREGKWIIMFLIGAFFLAQEINPAWNMKEYSTPALLIGVGLLFMLRPRNNDCDRNRFRSRFREGFDRFENFSDEKKNGYGQTTYPDNNSAEDVLDIVSVFGGTKKIITSKNFRGGEITSFLGGTELNLTQAEINGRVVLDITNILGGTKLIVPSHWDIKPELVAVFGSIEDKRNLTGAVDPTKILVLKGSCVFGGLDISSF